MAALPPAAKLRPVQLTIESRECVLAKYIRQAKAARVDVAEREPEVTLY